MAVDDNSVDECGTGRYTPPPSYQTMTNLDNIGYNLDPRNSSTLPYSSEDFYVFDIKTNTRKSAETVKKIRQLMENEDGVTDTLKAIRQMLEGEDGITMTLKGIYRMLQVHDGVLNSFVSMFTILLIIQLLFLFYYFLSIPYPTKNIVNDLKTVENLNLTENDMQLILNFARRHVLVDLKDCISEYLSIVP